MKPWKMTARGYDNESAGWISFSDVGSAVSENIVISENDRYLKARVWHLRKGRV